MKVVKTGNNKIFINNIANKIIIDSFKSYKRKNNKSKYLTYIPNIRTIRKPIFLTFRAKIALKHLGQVFVKTLIL